MAPCSRFPARFGDGDMLSGLPSQTAETVKRNARPLPEIASTAASDFVCRKSVLV
jgi:hypothetical protein